MLRVLAGLTFLGVALQPALGAEPVYQEVADAGCRVTETDEVGSISLCTGPDGTPFVIADGDLRISVTFGGVDENSRPRFQSFGQFNHIGETIEWRLGAGRAVAAILRWHIDAEEEAMRGSVLVVSKVGTLGDPGCVTGYVDARANPNANELARELADVAPKVECSTHTPDYFGTRGPTAGEPTL